MRDALNIGARVDLVNYVVNDEVIAIVTGINTFDDSVLEFWRYDANSSLTHNGSTVLKPTAIMGNGRWLIHPSPQAIADWNAISGLSFILNKPPIPAAQVNSDWNAVSGVSQILNKPTIPNVSTVNNGVSRTINGGGFQVSATQTSNVNYTVQVASTLSLVTGQTGSIFLETSPNNSTWTEISRFSNGNTGTLTIGLSLTQTVTSQLNAFVPAGYYVRLRSTGTSSSSYITGQEIIY